MRFCNIVWSLLFAAAVVLWKLSINNAWRGSAGVLLQTGDVMPIKLWFPTPIISFYGVNTQCSCSLSIVLNCNLMKSSIPKVSMSKLRNSRNTLCQRVSQVRLQEDYDGLGWHQGFTSYMFNLAASLHVEFVIYGGTSTHFYLPTHHQHSSATCLEC